MEGKPGKTSSANELPSMDKIFQKQKEACLAGVDLSRKGSIDEPIVELVTYINSQEYYVTTSSCSGRIAVFSYPSSGEVKKKGCNWLYITHDKCTKEKVVDALKECDGDVFFKFEAFVLHVQCATLLHAQKLLAEAVASGYRNSGISVGKKGKIITAVRSTHSLEVPLSHRGNVMVSEEGPSGPEEDIDFGSVMRKNNSLSAELRQYLTEQIILIFSQMIMFFQNLTIALSTDILEKTSEYKPKERNRNKKADSKHHNRQTEKCDQYIEQTGSQFDSKCDGLSDLFEDNIDLNIFEPE